MEGGKEIKELEINEQIRDSKVRLIDQNGDQIGVCEIERALDLANDQGLDLVKISPNAKPPVCKILDYGKYRYEMQKREKEAKKNQKIIKVREMKMTPNIEENDMLVKADKVKEFLNNGDKVKISVRFRGREMGHTEKGVDVLEQFFKMIEDLAVIDKPAKLEGRNMVMYVLPKS
ncbi:MAG: translation initiation factor IF-3 [Ezakiella massiliensis]|uniref:translation initiation factor IF-3 n=1 Tax=Ezakiella massiliensis TaxID=1852374 RepID=UPI000A49D462|nr:translation initiation factor IF-3 [Ezakiella massiliensis]